MKFIHCIHIVFQLSFCLCFFGYAQQQQPNIKYFSLEEGLSQVTINDILQDKNGYVWIATQDGLNRFDGEKFKHYKHHDTDSTSISGNLTNTLLEDDKSNIWVGTIGNGLSYYNQDKERFYSVKLQYALNENETISDFAIDNDGEIWVASRLSGLHKLKYLENNTFSQKNYLPNLSLGALLYDANKTLWVGDFDGNIYNINPKKSNDITITPKFKINSRIRSFYNTEEHLLIGCDYGLYIYNFQNKKLDLFNFDITTNFSVKFISAFLKENDSSVWVGTGNGLFLLDWKKMKIIRKIEKSKNNIDGLSNNTVTALLKIDEDRILAGTANNLNFLNFKSPFFQNISKDKRGSHLLNDNVIFSILKDETDLWIGTSDGGLNLIRNGTPYYFEKVENDSTSTFGTVREIVKDHKNQRIWIATTRGIRMLNLKTFNPKHPKFTIFRYNPKDKNSISGDFLKGMTLDQNNNIWGATYGYGVFRLETKDSGKTKITRYLHNPENKNSLQSNVTMCVRTDKNQNIWIGTQGGLTKLHFQNSNYTDPIFTNYNKDSKQKNTLSNNSVYDILLDKNDSIWVGTRHGLNLFLGDNSFTSWMEQDQFTNAAVYTIQDDDLGNLWLGTNDGLVKFNTSKRKFTQYKSEDGIQSNEFDIHAKFKDNQGHIYLGGIGGVTYFNPQKIETIDQPNKLYFSELKIKDSVIKPNNAKGALLTKSIIKSNHIEFKHNQFPFYLHFSSIDFRDYKNVKYGYKLLPTDEDWNMLTDSRIQFLNLPSGDYNIQINGFSRGVEWNQAPLEMSLSILPPWYKTWLAYLFYLGIIVFIVNRFYKFQVSKKLAKAESIKLKEIDELKTKMYGNISHEFRTPLTLINGLSKILIEENINNDNTEKLKGIYRNGNQLLKLVNQILGLVSFDAKKVKANYKNGDVIVFIKQCVSYYKFHSDSKQQHLTLFSEIESLQMDFDDDKLQKIINNVLSNAIKFTPPKGKIDIELKKVNQNLIIIISDSGKGINEKHLPYIFDRYYKTFEDNIDIGNGIGMALTKELVNLLKGKINVESKINKGTTFTIQLPINNTVENTSEVLYELPFTDTTKTTEDTETAGLNKKASHTLLLVEDNKEIRNYITLLLGKIYNITIAKNGIEGLKIAKNKNIDFIISDVMMPMMDGFEFCKQIKSDLKTSHIPFIILSAKTAKEDILKGHKLGIDTYLFKPFDKDELLLIIKNLLQKKQEQINYFSKLLKLKECSDHLNTNQLDIDLIRDLQEYALNNNNKLSIDQLAKELGTSRTQLHRKVKALTEMSVTNYINHIRIEKAKHLLVNTKLNSNEIGFEVGFESSTYFSRIFKKELGMTPVLYRKQNT
ncbi:hybrid sensor histidine kinase/response regulator transcription factor [Winogradskyella psychrotolerans]|uniref:hybrid sensor histidine kinase/response regulator transcription factor n=1 Tax=Winogradskyella psychrotolerans TaxID=1344585 RepID=UPI001C07685B|nr:two-component regulator propeller domain-containing protein [Winogradskyella psychrotolerans]MBU2929351.1 response regulator [Winogradskyella psychrotolerans]